jgi:hypothetical protein
MPQPWSQAALSLVAGEPEAGARILQVVLGTAVAVGQEVAWAERHWVWTACAAQARCRYVNVGHAKFTSDVNICLHARGTNTEVQVRAPLIRSARANCITVIYASPHPCCCRKASAFTASSAAAVSAVGPVTLCPPHGAKRQPARAHGTRCLGSASHLAHIITVLPSCSTAGPPSPGVRGGAWGRGHSVRGRFITLPPAPMAPAYSS